ncbi:hypothetical protein BLOT_003040 [Blomia tropicalis]|nr:hypothetical protein BLOT_003040 [Blomia tropicalis]
MGLLNNNVETNFNAFHSFYHFHCHGPIFKTRPRTNFEAESNATTTTDAIASTVPLCQVTDL